MKVDVWSIGCIFAELLARRPLFPGSDNENQFNLVVDFLGTPNDEEINKIPKQKVRDYIKKMGRKQPKDSHLIFKNASDEALDLLKKLLMFDPDKRITVEGALKHPYLKDLHYPPDEVGKKNFI